MRDSGAAYLLLHFGPPRDEYPPTRGHLTAARSGVESFGAKLVVKRVSWSISGANRYFFVFRDSRIGDKAAPIIAELVMVALSLLAGPTLETDEGSLVLSIPYSLLGARKLELDALVEAHELLPFEEWLPFPSATIAQCTSVSAFTTQRAWLMVPLLAKHESLRRAARFLHASYEEFFVYPGQIRDVLADPSSTPQSAFGQNRVENALQSAFKAVEAIIGDPPKDDRRFDSKLKKAGVEPTELVGYSTQRPIKEWLREMNVARGKRAAHGSTKDRRITALELLEFQACAHYVFGEALESARHGRYGG